MKRACIPGLGVAFLVLGLARPAWSQGPAGDTTTIARIHEAVLSASPDLLASRAGVALARGRLAAAGFGTPVVLSAEAEDIPGGVNLTAASVRLFAEKAFLPASQQAAERQVALADVAAASARMDALRHLVIARADRALVRAVGYAAIARRLADEDAVLSSAEESLRSRFAVGQGSYVDVLRLRTERLRVQTERGTAVAQAQAGLRAFDALLPPDSSARSGTLALVDSLVERAPVRSLVALLPPVPDVDSLISSSGALRIADAAVERARAERSLLAARQKPQFSAFLGAQRFTGDSGGTTFGPVLGGSMSLPFTARRANQAALAAAELGLQAAIAERTARRANLRAELLAARDLYRAALERLAVYDSALLQAAEQEREGALAAYRTGQLSLTELLDFQRGLSRAMTDRLQSEIDAADALTQLLTTAWDVGDAPAAVSAP